MTSLTTSEKIGIKISILRKKMKLSQEKLGDLAGISKTSISSIERGLSVPSIDTLEKIAIALNTDLKNLVDVSKIDI